MIEVPLDKRPDRMGVWADEGERVWLPKEHHPTRTDARRFAMSEMECGFMEVKVLSRWMRYAPYVATDEGRQPIWLDDLWTECSKDEPNAFPVWRIEAYTLPRRS